MSLLDAVADTTAKIIVGSGANIRTFHIHKKLLCDSSTYFKAALNNGFAEAKDQIVNLDDEDPTVFAMYALWLYENKLTKETLPSSQIEGAFENHLFKLYVFADKRGIGNLANNTITMLATYWVSKHVTMSEVAWVVLLLSPNDKLYELIQDNLVLELREKLLEKPQHLLAAMDLPKEFLFNLFLRTDKLSKQFNNDPPLLRGSVVSQEDCVRSIEAGNNFYDDSDVVLEGMEQCAWKENASRDD